MSIIIGFSLTSSYDCEVCQSKCCSGEFDLTISKNEAEKYISLFPECKPFISTTKITEDKEKVILQRSDSCIFLNKNGNCRIQSQKPQICKIYPLVFWKISDSIILSYVFPCRGLGFDWNSHQAKFTEEKVKVIYKSIENDFNDYYAEYIDEYNPYETIDIKRIKKEQILHKEKLSNSVYWNQFKDKELKTNFSKTIDELKNLAKVIFGESVENPLNVSNYINSALYWLAFNPNTLIFDFEESVMIRLFASIWNIELSNRVPKQSSEIDHLLANQIAWNAIAVATQDFWYNFDIRFLSQVDVSKYQNLHEFVQQMIEATEDSEESDKN